jgi:CBS-domain-containing membrane protein
VGRSGSPRTPNSFAGGGVESNRNHDTFGYYGATTAALADSIRVMLEQHVSGLPVVDDGRYLLGLLTEGDLLRRVETGTEKRRPGWLNLLFGPGQATEDYVRSRGRRVVELMTRDVVTVSEDTQIEDIVELMETRRIRRVPVVRDGRLVGVISRPDLLHLLAKALEPKEHKKRSDAALRRAIMAELRRHSWGRTVAVSVIVADGIAYLKGTVSDDRERDAVRVAAENVEGVRELRDNLEYWDPNTVMAY